MSKTSDLYRQIGDLQTRAIYNAEIQYRLAQDGIEIANQIRDKKVQLAEAEIEESQERYSRSVQDESSMAGVDNE